MFFFLYQEPSPRTNQEDQTRSTLTGHNAPPQTALSGSTEVLFEKKGLDDSPGEQNSESRNACESDCSLESSGGVSAEISKAQRTEAMSKTSPDNSERTQTETKSAEASVTTTETQSPDNDPVTETKSSSEKLSESGGVSEILESGQRASGTHVTVIQAPNSPTENTKELRCAAANSSDQNKSSVASTYQTVFTAPVPDKESVGITNQRSKTSSNVASKSSCSYRAGPKVVGPKGNSNSNTAQQRKTAAAPRPLAPPRQRSNLTKSKPWNKPPLKRDNSSASITNKSNKGRSKGKSAAPPRPQSASRANVKTKGQVKTGTSTKDTSGGVEDKDRTRSDKEENQKTEALPTSEQPHTPPTAKNVETTVPQKDAVSATKSEPRPQETTQASRPRSVKALLVQSATSESNIKDAKPKRDTYASKEDGATFENNSTKTGEPKCKITINGRESTIPEFNPNTLDLQKVNLSFVKQTKGISSGPPQVSKAAKAVKAVKVESETTNAGDVQQNAEFVPKPPSVEHEGPVIWDPFEQIREQNKPADLTEEEDKTRAKSARGNQNRLVVPGSRKASGACRNNSASKRNIKNKSGGEVVKKARPRSGKKKGAKKKKSGAEKQPSGWNLDHDEAPTFTKVKPFLFKHTDEHPDDDQDPNTASRRNSINKTFTARSLREVDSWLPNMAVGLEDLEEYTSTDESADSDAEVMEEAGTTRGTENNEKKVEANVVKVAKPKLATASLGSSQEADENSTLPEVETVRSSSRQASAGRTAKAKIISVESVREDPSGKVKSPEKTLSADDFTGILQNSLKGGRKQVSNPVFPGGSVPDKRSSLAKLPSVANNSPSEAQKQSQDFLLEYKRESQAGLVDLKSDEATEKATDDAKEITEKEGGDTTEPPNTHSKTDVRNSNEEMEEIIDEIIKSTPNPTTSFTSAESEPARGDKRKKKKRAREKFEQEMRKSHDGKAFKQVSE